MKQGLVDGIWGNCYCSPTRPRSYATSDAEGLIEIVLIGTMKCKDFRDEIARTCLILLLLGRIKLVKNNWHFITSFPPAKIDSTGLTN